MKKPPQKFPIPQQADPPGRWLIWYLLVTIAALWIWQEWSGDFAVRTIPYREFKAHLARREVLDGLDFYRLVGRLMPPVREPVALPDEGGPVAVAAAHGTMDHSR